ncbi:MAG: hypothetical protein ACR2M0_15000 [Chloroflexia bacterium]
MDEPFDTKTVLLSALWEGTGQLAAGKTTKGLILFGAGSLFGVLGGVVGTMLKLLTFGRRPIKALPDKLNPLALVWLGIYLYSLYDAYNIAAGTEDEEAELLDYEEYVPEVLLASQTPATQPSSDRNGTGLDQVAAVYEEQRIAHEEYVPEVPLASQAPAATAGASGSSTDLDWAAGVNKEQLMAALGDDEQVRGVYGQYLPSETLFHSLAEADNLIPVQAWQDAQGSTWTGGEQPPSDGAGGYLDSAAGQMPPGDQTEQTESESPG